MKKETQDQSTTPTSALQRLIAEDALGQLRRSEGLMAQLGSEGDELKLDWVEGIARLLADSTQLEEVEGQAQRLWQQGIRHIIWAGMGGSVLTVRVLAELGFCASQNGQYSALYPLDSTDPAALNALIHQIAASKQLSLDTTHSASLLHDLFDDVLMVGVSMGMTSEEPITHLMWFSELLQQASLPLSEHLLVMTLPNSYLDQFAQERAVPRWSLQLDGRTGTGGRMSAPTTRVFLLPVALYLTRLTGTTGQLRNVLQNAWQDYDLASAESKPAQHPFVQLAIALNDASQDSACRMLVEMPTHWEVLVAWIEQLMEESLGKGGKGIVAFHTQDLNQQARSYTEDGMLHVRVATENKPSALESGSFILEQPTMAASDPRARLAAVATQFLGWQLTMALYGYLQHITFAGQPAVENYKARARVLRAQGDPLHITHDWPAQSSQYGMTLLAPAHYLDTSATPAEVFARTLLAAARASSPQDGVRYLDLTFNGAVPVTYTQIATTYFSAIGNLLLGVPVKLRHAPADYHSTEQGEMDGLPTLISLRVLLREHEPVLFGNYSDIFLLAQAVSTWQAMLEQGRRCFLLVLTGQPTEAEQQLRGFFNDVTALVRKELEA